MLFEAATQEFVAREAINLEMEVEEWLDQMHTYFSHQHMENNYHFVNSGVDTKMASLPCMLSFYLHFFNFSIFQFLECV